LQSNHPNEKELKMTVFRRAVAAITAVCVFGTSLPVMAQPAPVPALITTDEALAASVQERVGALLARAEVRDALAARGVDAAQVEARVAALTDDEARLLAERLDQLPAGASDILGVLFAIFIILLITDILGLTKVFPFTRPIK
jgi:limonene-1,2-epoxide hydrolase